MTEKLPSVVIVGRPNVGKSTIFNRLTGTRRSIVTDEPGITRDRIYGTATWQGRSFEVVDTGGIVPDDKAAIPREILRQAQMAIEAASQLLLVVDARAGLMPLDAELARLLRRTGKPLAILANKVDTQMQESLAAPFYELSNDVYPVSAEHGYGFDDLLDAITAPGRLKLASIPMNEPMASKQSRPGDAPVLRKRSRKPGTRSRVRSTWPLSGGPMSGSRRCSIAWRARSARSSPIFRERRATPWTRS